MFQVFHPAFRLMHWGTQTILSPVVSISLEGPNFFRSHCDPSRHHIVKIANMIFGDFQFKVRVILKQRTLRPLQTYSSLPICSQLVELTMKIHRNIHNKFIQKIIKFNPLTRGLSMNFFFSRFSCICNKHLWGVLILVNLQLNPIFGGLFESFFLVGKLPHTLDSFLIETSQPQETLLIYKP